MTTSNADRVGKSITLLRDGLLPFIQREMRAMHGSNWQTVAARTLQDRAVLRGANPDIAAAGSIDFQSEVTLLLSHWEDVFRFKLGNFERNLIHEMNATRNRWAHQEPFSTEDTYRALDSAQRLLAAVGASTQAAELSGELTDLMRIRYEEQTRRERKRTPSTPIQQSFSAGVQPWRSVAQPHPDVASGRYLQAEFAADLAQVARGDGTDEYRDPVEFFRRTYLTDGLRALLRVALDRLSGTSGDPVVELQTNFGGGKTHTMLALYHLFSGVPSSSLLGLDGLLQEANISQAPKAQRAVLVGTSLSPTQERTKPDGTVVRTLWGELAWQLGESAASGGGKDAYALVANEDATGVAPGSEVLREVLELHAPCLILIDEWVAYARQLYHIEGLPGGNFDANTLNFAQSLTEAVRQVPNALLVASVPMSEIEVGGEGGQLALQHIKNTIGRMALQWRPATTDESFEIVRRRLFQPLAATDYPVRDAACQAFRDMYQKQQADFPAECREGAYYERMQRSYPIHPELFDRLFQDWSSLERFQRTRGVLRLMAAVIYTLYERNDGSPMILPASIPMDEPAVRNELTKYLEDNWVPVIERDIDGAGSLPVKLDQANQNFGRYSATRRVARAVFMGSAPTLKTSHRGIADRSVKLGSSYPGESVPTFGDALRRLSDEATHLYVDNGRYWYDTVPSVARTARDRAASTDIADVFVEIRKRVKASVANRKDRGEFQRVHDCPPTSADVQDEMTCGLVILDPKTPYSSNDPESAALIAALEFAEFRGNAPRLYQNMLVFLAADKARLVNLEQAVRLYLAWSSIEKESETLNLDPFQANQAKSKAAEQNNAISLQLLETYCWLLVPGQELRGPMEISPTRVTGQAGLAERASARLISSGALVKVYGSTVLRLDLDRVPLWRGNHVHVRQLVEDYARYLYLPRMTEVEVLMAAVREGPGRLTWETETFAIAEGWDETSGRYRGLRTGQLGVMPIDGSYLVVRPDVARQQIDADEAAREAARPPEISAPGGTSTVYQPQPRTTPEGMAEPGSTAAPKVMRRFYGSVKLNELKLSSSAGQIADEVVKHLAGLVDAEVEVVLEIRAKSDGGIPDNVIRTVSENARTLKFRSFEFEED